MLTKFHKILIGVLVAQLLLAIFVFTRSSDTGAAREQLLVSGFDAAKVTRVQVFNESAETASVDLAKRGAAWVMASHFDHPVDGTKVTTALEPLAKVAGAKPIAKSSTRHAQLRVGDKAFEKKVIVSIDRGTGGKDLVFFLGASAGLRRNAFRLAGDDRVWGVTGMHSGSVGELPSQWIDTSYYKTTPADIAKLVVQGGGKTLEIARVSTPAPAPLGSGSAGSGSAGSAGTGSGSAAPAAESWQVTVNGAPLQLAAGETFDATAIESHLGTVSSISMRAPGDPKRDASKPTATITIHKKSTGAAPPAPEVLEVIADTKDNVTDYWVHQQGVNRAAIVDGAVLKSLLALDPKSLVKKPQPAGAGSGSPPPPGMPNGLPPGIELPPGFVPPPPP